MAGGGRFKIKGGIASHGEAVVEDGALLITGVAAGGTDNHNLLINLGPPSDDHPQYLHLPGRAGGQVAFGGTAVAEELELSGSTDAALGRIRLSSPVTLDDVSLGDQVAFRYDATFSTAIPFIGGFISSFGTVSFSNAFFIWALLAEGKVYEEGVDPGFAAFTLFNALPQIVNDGNFDLVQALVLNAGVQHHRNSAGTSTTVQTVGLSFAPMTRASIAGAVMTKTAGDNAVRFAPVFSTVAGATANFGTLRGLHCLNPAQGLFQPGGGVETMTAYLGVDINAVPFGGNVLKVGFRSALVDATLTRMIQNLSTAQSEFGFGDIHLNDNTAVKLGASLASPDILLFWDTASSSFRISPFFGTGGNPLDFTGTATDEWIIDSGLGDIGIQFDVDTISFGTTASTPNSSNFFTIFAAPNLRQVQIAGEYSDVLWTAGGAIDVNGLAVSDLQAFKINSPAVILNGGTILDFSNLFVQAMPSFGGTRMQALRVLGRSRLDGLMTHNEATLAQLTADVAALALPPNNLGRFVLLQDADNLGPWTIQGIVNVQVGDSVYFINNGANAWDFGHEDAGAAAADRIITPTAATWTLGAREFAKLWYDPVATRWRILESNGA